MLIFNTYLDKYVRSLSLSVVRHTDNKKEALKLNKKDAQQICSYLNTAGCKHYVVVDDE